MDVVNMVGVITGGAVVGVVVLYFLPYAVADFYQEVRERRRKKIEAELDRRQEELRLTILQLASALNEDASHARRALVRECFLARGEVSKD